MSQSLICRPEALILLELIKPLLDDMIEASVASNVDFHIVEQAVGGAIAKMRPILVSQSLSTSIKYSSHDYGCPDCGNALTHWGNRPRSIMTAEGGGEVGIPRYRCVDCRCEFNPILEGNALVGTRFTLGAKERIVEEASEQAYAGASETLPRMGIDVSAKEVDRIVVETATSHRSEYSKEIDAWKAAQLCASKALFFLDDDTSNTESSTDKAGDLYDWSGWQGHYYAQISVDGAMVRSPEAGPDGKLKWFEQRSGLIRPLDKDAKIKPLHVAGVQSLDDIFDWLRASWQQRPAWVTKLVYISDDGQGLMSRARLYFPEALEILDIYHAGEHVGSAADAIWGEGSEQAASCKVNARSIWNRTAYKA